ncbi:MAG: ubiquinol-cytochrome c reductase iron-sulfur subunit [Pseudomonadota bacterium]
MSADDAPSAVASAAPPNAQRRYFLVGLTSTVGALGAVGAAVPFVQSWVPSAKARAAGAPVRIDISKLQPGEMLGPTPAWRGQPVFVLYRTPEVLENLETIGGDLADPDSDVESQTPEYAKNTYRSRRAEIGVYLGLCTHLGCSPKYQPTVTTAAGSEWTGSFFCPCHGSRFDLAGRVAKAVPAPSNLLVPPYRFEGENVIIVGEEGGAA